MSLKAYKSLLIEKMQALGYGESRTSGLPFADWHKQKLSVQEALEYAVLTLS